MATTHNGFTFDAGGFILATNSAVEAGDIWRGGLRFREIDGALRTSLSAADFTQQGWPMATGSHAVCYAASDPVSVQNGLPFASSGGLAVSGSGGVDHWQNGLPFVGPRFAIKQVS